MEDNLTYVRRKLTEARTERGKFAQVARDTETDARTMRTLLDGSRAPNKATVNKLAAYFKRADRKLTAASRPTPPLDKEVK